MSGGSYNYIYLTLLNNCEGQMFDDEMEEMLKDFAEVLHDLEWWCSSDISEEKYRQTVKEFKNKWFKVNNKHKTLNEQRIAEGLEPVEHKMTKEEAIRVLKEYIALDEDIYNEYLEAQRVAIKSLEQEPILDKIRAEIEQKCSITVGRECDSAITLYDVFQIIDKYKENGEE